MKKTYQAPDTPVNELHMANTILAGSPDAIIDPDNVVEAAQIESRLSYNVWGDDEEDE